VCVSGRAYFSVGPTSALEPSALTRIRNGPIGDLKDRVRGEKSSATQVSPATLGQDVTARRTSRCWFGFPFSRRRSRIVAAPCRDDLYVLSVKVAPSRQPRYRDRRCQRAVDDCAAALPMHADEERPPVRSGRRWNTSSRFITKAYVVISDGSVWRFNLTLDANRFQPCGRRSCLPLAAISHRHGHGTVNVGGGNQYNLLGTRRRIACQRPTSGRRTLAGHPDNGVALPRRCSTRTGRRAVVQRDRPRRARRVVPAIAGDDVFSRPRRSSESHMCNAGSRLYAFT